MTRTCFSLGLVGKTPKEKSPLWKNYLFNFFLKKLIPKHCSLFPEWGFFPGGFFIGGFFNQSLAVPLLQLSSSLRWNYLFCFCFPGDVIKLNFHKDELQRHSSADTSLSHVQSLFESVFPRKWLTDNFPIERKTFTGESTHGSRTKSR